IIARILVENVRSLSAHVDDEGILLASGIIEQREEEVLEAFRSHGLHAQGRKSSGDWVTLTFTKAEE
ncbi:MAG: 50S ribosomal protein L11 methyltransferase, partial [Chloroflexota bacterium]